MSHRTRFPESPILPVIFDKETKTCSVPEPARPEPFVIKKRRHKAVAYGLESLSLEPPIIPAGLVPGDPRIE